MELEWLSLQRQSQSLLRNNGTAIQPKNTGRQAHSMDSSNGKCDLTDVTPLAPPTPEQTQQPPKQWFLGSWSISLSLLLGAIPVAAAV